MVIVTVDQVEFLEEPLIQSFYVALRFLVLYKGNGRRNKT